MLRGVEPLLPGSVERHLLVERAKALVATDVTVGDPARAALARAATTLIAF